MPDRYDPNKEAAKTAELYVIGLVGRISVTRTIEPFMIAAAPKPGGIRWFTAYELTPENIGRALYAAQPPAPELLLPIDVYQEELQGNWLVRGLNRNIENTKRFGSLEALVHAHSQADRYLNQGRGFFGGES